MADGGLGTKNIRLVLEYDGTDFCGWQRQPKVRTVEGELVEALRQMTGFAPEIISAARTDSGVHALGQVVNFSSISALGATEVKSALNSILPGDLRVIDADEAPLAFNARYDAKARTYRYEIATRPTAVWRNYRWFVKWNLDLGAMREAAGLLVGEHDFTAYTSKDEARSPWISLTEVSIQEIDAHAIACVFKANRFLRKMVRMLVGTLVDTGRGRLRPSDPCAILSNRDRHGAGPCAPSHGLYLVGVEF